MEPTDIRLGEFRNGGLALVCEVCQFHRYQTFLAATQIFTPIVKANIRVIKQNSQKATVNLSEDECGIFWKVTANLSENE